MSRFHLKSLIREFLAAPVVRTQHFQCRGSGSIFSQGSKISQVARPGQKNKLKLKSPITPRTRKISTQMRKDNQ